MLDVLGDGVDRLRRQAEGFADVADGRTGAVGDRFGGDAGAIAAVLLVKVLKHFLAALVLEIDVDVGGLVPLAADETLEEHVHSLGIDGGDAEAVADRRIGGRAATLAQDAASPGELHQIPDGEKIRLVMQLGDQLQLVLQQPADFWRHAARPALGSPGPGELREVLVGRHARRGQLLGIFVAQLVERKRALLGDLDRAAQGVRRVGKENRHFLGRFQVPLGVGKQTGGHFGHRAVVPHGGQHVVQRRPLGDVIMHVAGRCQRDAGLPRDFQEPLQSSAVVGAVVQFGEEGAAVAEEITVGGERGERRGERDGGVVSVSFSSLSPLPSPLSPYSGQQSPAVLSDVFEAESALALGGAAAAEGDQTREAAVRGPIGGPKHDRRGIVGGDFGADDQFQAVVLGGPVRPHYAG